MSATRIIFGWRDVLVLTGGTTLALGLLASTVVAVLMLASESYVDAIGPKTLATVLVTTLYALFAFASTLVIRQKRFTIGMFLAILLSIAAPIVWMVLIWEDLHGRRREEVLWLGFALSLPILALLHTGAFACLRTRSTGMFVLKTFTWGSVWVAVVPVTGMLVAAFLFGEVFTTFDWFLMTILSIAFLLGIVALFGSIPVVMLIGRSNRKWEEARETVAGTIELNLECPLCDHPQSVRTGHATCAACAALMHVELEEPRCECGYLLYKLRSATCPECGREVDEKHRWREAQQGDEPTPRAKPQAIEAEFPCEPSRPRDGSSA